VSYKLPKKERPKDENVKSVMFRLPVDLLLPFNEVLKKSNLSAQLLVEDMVRHCLNEVKAK